MLSIPPNNWISGHKNNGRGFGRKHQGLGKMAKAFSKRAALAGSAISGLLLAEPALAQVDTIVVTAQKREESLQEVPIAVSAITGESAEARGITSTVDLAQSVPSLQITNLSGRPLFALRGIGNSSVAPGEESLVSVYVDGVYISSLNGGLFSFNNIERIEVLKGPQGTLFGRNAVGGVINITTNDPSQDPQLDMRIGYGNYDTLEGSAYASLGLTENLAASVAFYGRDQNGSWGTNVFTGEEVYDNSEWAIRGKAKWDIGDRTTVRAIGEYSENDSQLGLSFAIPEGALGADGMSTNVGFFNSTGNFQPRGSIDNVGTSLNINHEFGSVDLTSISAWSKNTNEYYLDQDGTPVPIVDVIVNATVETFTQELRLSSTNDGPLTWLIGAYLQDTSAEFDPLVIGGFAAAPLPFQNIFSRQLTDSIAGFGQATYDITDRTSFTAGLRYTRDKQQFNATIEGPGGFVLVQAPDQEETFSKLTWRFALDHAFTDDVLGYISYNRGFKSGVFNTVSPFDPAVRPSTVDAYEIGLKTLLADRRVRLNIAGFRYDYDDIQLQRAAAGITQLFNAASARTYGADLDVEIVLDGGLALTGGIGFLDTEFLSFPNAPISTPNPMGGNIITVGDVSGRALPNSPEWTANIGLLYTVDTGYGELQIAGNGSYTDEFFWTAGSALTEPDKFLLNGSIQWTAPSGRWDLRFWAKNITNEQYSVYSTDGQLGNFYNPAPPRTFGGSLGVHF